jgi:HJR/Mrr/RecB family endonuclease
MIKQTPQPGSVYGSPAKASNLQKMFTALHEPYLFPVRNRLVWWFVCYSREKDKGFRTARRMDRAVSVVCYLALTCREGVRLGSMRKRSEFWIFCFLAGAVAALTLLAAGLSQVRLAPGEPFVLNIGRLNLGGREPGMPGWTNIGNVLLLILVWGLLPVLVLALIFSAEFRRTILQRALMFVIWTLVIYGALRAFQAATGQLLGSGFFGSTRDPSLVQVVPSFVTNPPAWLVTLITLLVLALFAGAILVVWRRMQSEAPAIELVGQEAQDALDELHAGGNLHDIVVRCYIEMGRVVARQTGVQRHEAMTPREFEARLAMAGLREDHIRRLTRLFEAVRYGTQAPSKREEREAVECLSAIVQFCKGAA